MAIIKNKALFAVTLSMFLAMASSYALGGADFAVYAGDGTWEPSITAFENFLLWKNLTYEEVNKNDINNNDLRPLYTGIFFPEIGRASCRERV